MGGGGAARGLYLSWVPVQSAWAVAAPRGVVRDGVECGTGHGRVHDGVRRRGGRRPPSRDCGARDSGRQWARSDGVPSGPGCPETNSDRVGGRAETGRDRRRVSPGAPQRLHGITGRHGKRSRRRAMGRGRPPDVGPGRGLPPGPSGSASGPRVGLSHRRSSPAGSGRRLRPAEPFRGPADVDHRGNADRVAGGEHHDPRSAGAGG